MSAGLNVSRMEASAPERKPVKLRPLQFEDYAQISVLESRFGLNPRSENEWRHLWLENPAFRDVEKDWDIGWVLEDEDRRIVASLGSVPVWYELDGRRILACTGKGLVGEPAHRSGCLLLLDQLINKAPMDLYINNTVGDAVASAFELFDCPRVPVGAWDRTGLWIASHKGLAESLLASTRFRGAAGLRYPLAAAAFLWDRLKSRALPCRGIDIKECRMFDDRFDDFWENLRTNQPGVLLALRTRETLAWHFKLASAENRLWIATVGDKTLAAYAIFERKDGGHGGSALKRVRLADFQSMDGSTGLLPAFLDWAIGRCRREGIHFLEITGRWLEKGDLIDTLAPYHRTLPVWTFFYSARTPALADRLKQPGVWAPTLFDGEATLW